MSLRFFREYIAPFCTILHYFFFAIGIDFFAVWLAASFIP